MGSQNFLWTRLINAFVLVVIQPVEIRIVRTAKRSNLFSLRGVRAFIPPFGTPSPSSS